MEEHDTYESLSDNGSTDLIKYKIPEKLTNFFNQQAEELSNVAQSEAESSEIEVPEEHYMAAQDNH